MLTKSMLLVSIAVTCAFPAFADGPVPKYPSLDAEQIAHIRNTIALAEQPGFENMQEGPRGAFDQYQYQIAWMYYGLAVAQTQLTPAYRELYHKISDDLIRKMMNKDVWSDWLLVVSNPSFNKFLDRSKDYRDPVREKNIMYSGHLLQMVGLYERVYADQKYEKMGSISFGVPGWNGFNHNYSFQSLAQDIRQQFIENDYLGVECEPNFIFAECNQHPILGLIDYDKLHGTRLSDIKSAFWEKGAKIGFLNKETSRFAGPYLVKESSTVPTTSAWNDGWIGITLHAWNREAVNAYYPTQRDAELTKLLDPTPAAWSARWSQATVSTDFGFLAAYAAEMDDKHTRDELLDYADAHFHPVMSDGRLFYPRHDVDTGVVEQVSGDSAPLPPKPLRPDQYGEHLVGPLTGNALIAFARLNSGNGLWNLYNNLDATYVDGAPELIDVSYPQVVVSQAFYDRASRRLALAFQPGTYYSGVTNFAIHNLSKKIRYVVTINGKAVASLTGAQVVSTDPNISIVWDKDGNLAISAELRDGLQVVVDESKERPATVMDQNPDVAHKS